MENREPRPRVQEYHINCEDTIRFYPLQPCRVWFHGLILIWIFETPSVCSWIVSFCATTLISLKFGLMYLPQIAGTGKHWRESPPKLNSVRKLYMILIWISWQEEKTIWLERHIFDLSNLYGEYTPLVHHDMSPYILLNSIRRLECSSSFMIARII
jgi:hypothetical protein